MLVEMRLAQTAKRDDACGRFARRNHALQGMEPIGEALTGFDLTQGLARYIAAIGIAQTCSGKPYTHAALGSRIKNQNADLRQTALDGAGIDGGTRRQTVCRQRLPIIEHFALVSEGQLCPQKQVSGQGIPPMRRNDSLTLCEAPGVRKHQRK